MSQLPVDCRVESFINPLAIDTPRPRLSWKLQDTRVGARQTAYRIVVAPTRSDLEAQQNLTWDTGKVASDQSVFIDYAGPKLTSRQVCWWQVKTWDADGKESNWSTPAFWEMGLLDRSDWQAEWIGAGIVGGSYTIPPVPYFRKSFDLDKPVRRARLYVTALGMHEFHLNGKPVSDVIFAPGRTEYRKRVPYHVFDITAQLRTGQNICGAILGDGWYCGHLHSDPRQTYGDRPRLLAQLQIEFNDGTRRTIGTDPSWKWSEGPIRSSDMLMGEDYDARLEIPGWNDRGFDDSGWRSALRFDDPGIAIVAHRAPPVKKHERIRPVAAAVTSLNRRRNIIDLGQNMVGFVRLRIRNAKPGHVISLRHVEMLDADGKPYVLALRTARATDHYTCRGGEEEVFEPKFTFHGFRYVEIRDYPGIPTADDIEGIVVHSDTPPTGRFECSDPMINQLQHNILWSQKGNFIDIPTDCPQRDERLGWTGDAQVFIRTAAFNMDVGNFFHKWLLDVADSQYDDGHIPSVVPHVTSIHHEGGPAWADAAVICPWVIYLCYGDKRILEDRYETMKRFVDWMNATSPNHIRADENQKWRGYGDWLSHDAYTPPDLIGTAFFSYSAKLFAQAAEVLGRKDDATQYHKLADDVRAAWRNRYVTPDGLIVAQTQTAYVLALHFELIEDAHRARVVDQLVRDIRKRGMHLSTGFVGTPYLNHVLTQNGHADIAYALLHQKTFPSWLFPVTHGATTMWERWDGWTPEKGFNDAGMNSYNHYAYGAVGEWMYSTVAGIDLDPDRPGYKQIIIRPHPKQSGLTHASATLESPYGKIASAWKLEGATLSLDVTIPPNTTATIRVPASDPHSVRESNHRRPTRAENGLAIYDVGAGTYRFTATL